MANETENVQPEAPIAAQVVAEDHTDTTAEAPVVDKPKTKTKATAPAPEPIHPGEQHVIDCAAAVAAIEPLPGTNNNVKSAIENLCDYLLRTLSHLGEDLVMGWIRKHVTKTTTNS